MVQKAGNASSRVRGTTGRVFPIAIPLEGWLGGSRHPATAELNLEQRREAILLVKAPGQAVLPQPTSPLCLLRGEACCSHLASGSLLPGPVLGSLRMLPLIPEDTSP